MGLTRGEFFARVGLIREVEPMTDAAYRFFERLEAEKSDHGAGAAHKWHVSFHGSQFPGDDDKACGRQALYRMLDTPRGMFTRRSRQIMDAGKDIENRLVMTWHTAGVLLTPPPWEKQLEFEDPAHWLTSTVDAIVVPTRSLRPVVAEVKTKYAKDIEDMRRLLRGPDEKHVNQIKCQIGLAHEAGPQTVRRCFNTGRLAVKVGSNGSTQEICAQHRHDQCLEEVTLEPVEYGYIYYVSRDNPVDTWEFYVEHDPEFMRKGREHLAQWREWFDEGVLPHENFVAKRYAHPFGWKWTELPCKWCDFGDACRKDTKAALEKGEPLRLRESEAIVDAIYGRADYDYEAVRAAVYERWGLEPIQPA